MRKLLSAIVCFSLGAFCLGQDLNDGLYTSIEDFQYNDPVPPTYLINNLDIRERDYLEKVVELDSIRYYNRESDEMIIENTELWGYCRNEILHVYFDEQFARVQVVGSLCHFTTMVEVVTYVTDPFDRMGMPNQVVSLELMENMIDVASGKVSRFTDEYMSIVLQRDAALYREYNSLSIKDREQQRFRFLTRYNERNPLKFLD